MITRCRPQVVHDANGATMVSDLTLIDVDTPESVSALAPQLRTSGHLGAPVPCRHLKATRTSRVVGTHIAPNTGHTS